VIQEREASTDSSTQQTQDPQQPQQPDIPVSQQDFATAAAKFVAEAVASPIFYLVAGESCMQLHLASGTDDSLCV
jgi:hypothetical protein